MSDSFEQLRILSIGVSDYSQVVGLECVPSASFDAILVANRYEAQGFHRTHLVNPTKQEVEEQIQRIIRNIEDFHNMKFLSTESSFVVIYFNGHANEKNEAIFSDGSTLSLINACEPFKSIQYNNILIFQDCLTTSTNFGEILCKPISYRNISDSLDRFLKFQKNSLLTNQLLLQNLDDLVRYRNRVIENNNLHLYLKEKELNAFMLKYFTECSNLYVCEVALYTLKEFQDKLTKQIAQLNQLKKKQELIDEIKRNAVTNQFCELVDVTPINMDVSEKYKTLELKLLHCRRYLPLTVIYTEDRVAVLEVSSKRKEIVGSYNVQATGGSDQKIITICQGYLNHELYILTSKDKLIKLKIDNSGQLVHSNTFKLLKKREFSSTKITLSKGQEKCEITSITTIDDYFFLGYSDGIVQIYLICADGLHLMQEFQIFGPHVTITGMLIKRGKYFREYSFYISGRLNTSKIVRWADVYEKLPESYRTDWTVEMNQMFLHQNLQIRGGDTQFKIKNIGKALHQSDVHHIQDFDSFIAIQSNSNSTHQLHKFTNPNTITAANYNDKMSQYRNSSPITNTMIQVKGNKQFFLTLIDSDNKINIFEYAKSIHFTLFTSYYQNMQFAGQAIWYAQNKFVVPVKGEECLMLADLIVDKDLVSVLSQQ